MITITSVRVQLKPRDNLIGFAEIVIGGGIVLKEIRIIDRANQSMPPLVAMPAQKLGNGTWSQYFHPINKPTRTSIENAVLAEYDKVKCK